MNDSHMNFNDWFLKEVADDDGGYNKPVYESAKWAWEYKQKELDEKLKKLNDTVDWHIEDCYIGEDTEYNNAWLESMLLIKHELEKFKLGVD